LAEATPPFTAETPRHRGAESKREEESDATLGPTANENTVHLLLSKAQRPFAPPCLCGESHTPNLRHTRELPLPARCPTSMLEARHLTKLYTGVPAVDRVSFTIRPGEILGYLGPNGAGKSTTVKMLTGLIEPTSGHIFFHGEDVRHDLK